MPPCDGKHPDAIPLHKFFAPTHFSSASATLFKEQCAVVGPPARLRRILDHPDLRQLLFFMNLRMCRNLPMVGVSPDPGETDKRASEICCDAPRPSDARIISDPGERQR